MDIRKYRSSQRPKGPLANRERWGEHSWDESSDLDLVCEETRSKPKETAEGLGGHSTRGAQTPAGKAGRSRHTPSIACLFNFYEKL
jgi:hypothetical protein